MATLATGTNMGNTLVFTGGIGVSANDVVMQSPDCFQYEEFTLSSTAGSFQVIASVDGSNYESTNPLSLLDLGATSSAPVVVASPNRVYSFFGLYYRFRVTQNGATAVTGLAVLMRRKSIYN